MAAVRPPHTALAELSDDDGCDMTVGGPSRQLDGAMASVMYLRRHGDAIHEALDVSKNPTTYSEDRKRLALLRTPDLRIFDEYRMENPDMPFDVHTCSWEDLFEQMAKARGDHEARTSKKGHWFKYMWRKAGSQGDATEPWLQLIPEEYGLTVLRGAIGILFHMAEKTYLREKAALEGFETITEAINDAVAKGVSFREPELVPYRQALYDCLVDGVADLIKSLRLEGRDKTLRIPFRNKQEKRRSVDVEALLKRVQKKAAELDQAVQKIRDRMSHETHRGVKGLANEAHITREIVTHVRLRQEETLDVARETEEGVQRVGRDVQRLGAAAFVGYQSLESTMQHGFRDLRDSMLLAQQDRQQSVTALLSQDATKSLMVEIFQYVSQQHRQMLDAQREQLIDEVRRALTPVPPDDRPALGAGELLDLLAVPLALVDDDLQAALSRSAEFGRRSQQQAQSLLATDVFGRWLHGATSEVLLVDGNDAAATRGLVSPMSLLAATLGAGLESARGADAVLVLHFFCGLHAARSDGVQGPMGLLRALLAQLVAGLLRLGVDPALPGGQVPDAFCDDVRDELPDALFWVLDRLLALVPPDVAVFCFIDGVPAFEAPQFRDGLVAVVGWLEDFVAHGRVTLKVLYLCPYRSIVLAPQEHIDRLDYLLLDAGGRGGRGRISARTVGAYVA